MEENRAEIEDLMQRFGYEENEARAAYHLRTAQGLFDEIFASPPGTRGVGAILDEVYFGTHFRSLRNALARRVLQRDYPRGWGRTAEPKDEA